MTARTPAKAESVISLLKAQNPSSTTTYSVVGLDLSSLSSVRAAAPKIQALAPAIDVLLLNAGVMAVPSRTLSEDGVEMHLATNFLGHFLLTTLVLPQLKAAAAGARVINITSAGFVLTPFRFADYNFDGGKALPESERANVDVAAMMGFADLDPQSGYVPMLAYAQANVANMLFAKRISDLYGNEGVISLSAAPGGASSFPD